MTEYDLIVIGSGPAGEKGAAQAAYFGKRVAVIEKDAPLLGGASTNTGTLPSKTLRESALALSGIASRGLEDVVIQVPKPLAAATLMFRERHVVEKERGRIRWNLESRHGVKLYAGAAKLVDPHTVQVNGERLTAPVILLATGSRPHRPSWIPFEEELVYDSDEILVMKNVPESLIVLGSGVIACEYACLFAALGTDVTILDGRDKLLGFLDDELVDAFGREVRRLGMKVQLGDAPNACSVKGDVCTVGTVGGKTYTAGAVLAAAGRSGNTAGLGLEEIGIAPDKRGSLTVNEHFQTAVPHIYAAGDVVGFPALASVSMEQGRVAVCHAFGFTYKQKISPLLPMGIYTIPEISAIGATEGELKQQGVDYVVGRALMSMNARGQILGAENGFLKLLFSPDKKLLGAHLFGPGATDLIHIGLMAMHAGSTIDVFIDAVFNYPTLSELY